mgnify:CR=1 FL=1
MRVYREFTVRRRGGTRVLFENSRKIRYSVETEFVGNFAERHRVLFDKFQRFVDFQFYRIVDYRFVIGSSERPAYMRNAVIQVGGDSAGYCKSLKMIGAKVEPQKFRSTYDGGDVYLVKLYN